MPEKAQQTPSNTPIHSARIRMKLADVLNDSVLASDTQSSPEIAGKHWHVQLMHLKQKVHFLQKKNQTGIRTWKGKS